MKEKMKERTAKKKTAGIYDEYPAEVREMLLSVDESTSCHREKVCRRPWCQQTYTAWGNTSELCCYHPGALRDVNREATEGEVLSGAADDETGFVTVREWTCCGQEYFEWEGVDLSTIDWRNVNILPCRKCKHS